MALATLHIAAIRLLVAGTGAVAAFVSGGQPVQTAAISTETLATGKSCDTQTWPYIEQRCLAGKANVDKRPVRLATAPVTQPNETVPAATPNAPAASAAPSGDLVTRDTSCARRTTPTRLPLYQIPCFPSSALTRKQMRREARQQRAERRWAAQSYQVPGEIRYGNRPVIVVRPLRLDSFR